MKHAREDYQRRWPRDPALDDPSLLAPGASPIAPDEPVFLLRGHDRLAPHNLLDYAARAEESGLPEVAESVRAQARRMREWQAQHGEKLPDLPAATVPTNRKPKKGE